MAKKVGIMFFLALVLGVLSSVRAEDEGTAVLPEGGVEGSSTERLQGSGLQDFKLYQFLVIDKLNDKLREFFAPSERRTAVYETVLRFMKKLIASYEGEGSDFLEVLGKMLQVEMEGERKNLEMYRRIKEVAAEIDSGLTEEEEREKRGLMVKLLAEFEDFQMKVALDMLKCVGFSESDAYEYFNRHPFMGPSILFNRIVVTDYYRRHYT